jgi:hypothetical protein
MAKSKRSKASPGPVPPVEDSASADGLVPQAEAAVDPMADATKDARRASDNGLEVSSQAVMVTGDAPLVVEDAPRPVRDLSPAAALAATPLPPEPDPLPLPAGELVSPVQALVPVVRTPPLDLAVSQAPVPVAHRRPASLLDQIVSLCATPLVLVLGVLALPGQWLGSGSSPRRH